MYIYVTLTIVMTPVDFLAALSGSKAYLPDVAQCTFMGIFCDARKCPTDFFKNLRKNPGNCRYNTLTKLLAV